jgi:hypothetical protein
VDRDSRDPFARHGSQSGDRRWHAEDRPTGVQRVANRPERTRGRSRRHRGLPGRRSFSREPDCLQLHRATYFDPSNPPFPNVAQNAQYGIFVGNGKGPGVIQHSYASNMADSGFYIGACPDCNTVLNHVHAQNNAQGISGTNSGGHLVLENSVGSQPGRDPSQLAGHFRPAVAAERRLSGRQG